MDNKWLPPGAATHPLRDCTTGLYIESKELCQVSSSSYTSLLEGCSYVLIPQHLSPDLPTSQALVSPSAEVSRLSAFWKCWFPEGIWALAANATERWGFMHKECSKYSCPPLSTKTSHYLTNPGGGSRYPPKQITDHSPSQLVLFLSLPEFIPFLPWGVSLFHASYLNSVFSAQLKQRLLHEAFFDHSKICFPLSTQPWSVCSFNTSPGLSCVTEMHGQVFLWIGL